MRKLGQRAAELLGTPVQNASVLAGGDLSAPQCLELADGRRVVAKTGPLVAAEAEMLQSLRDAEVPAPRILGCDGQLLLMEYLPQDSLPAWADLGAQIRRLHQVSGPAYGWHCDYAFADLTIVNTESDNWPEFWAQRRLLAHLSDLPPDLAKRLERLADSLPQRLPRTPPPSLLHGDLWSGNFLCHQGRLTGLIDPACYYGHGEVDLAMLRLFGAPGPEFFAAYGTLEPGHEQRRAIYTLWPALVHLLLFGSGYRGLVEANLTRAGA